jgi:ferredoxin
VEVGAAGPGPARDAGDVVSGTWRVTVDPHVCIGSGICAGTAPEHFTVTDGVAITTGEPIPPAQSVVDAADSCPVEAIAVYDTADDHLVAPEP